MTSAPAHLHGKSGERYRRGNRLNIVYADRPNETILHRPIHRIVADFAAALAG